MGLFRKKIEKVFHCSAGEPILAEREVTKEIDVDGRTFTKVLVERSDLANVVMPTKEEYDLEEQLKAGAAPQKINVRGVLSNPNGEFDAITAFNSLQAQIDGLSNVDNSVNVKSE